MGYITPEKFRERLARIKLLALDIDGVFTDDCIYFGPDGMEMKKFNASDGLFVALAMKHGLEVAIVSGRYSKATDSRMKDLGLKHILQGGKDKVAQIAPLLKELGIGYDDIAFLGNELLDVGLAKVAGLSVAVADSCQRYLEEVDFVTQKNGGHGAVREVLEHYFEAVGVDPLNLVR